MKRARVLIRAQVGDDENQRPTTTVSCVPCPESRVPNGVVRWMEGRMEGRTYGCVYVCVYERCLYYGGRPIVDTRPYRPEALNTR